MKFAEPGAAQTTRDENLLESILLQGAIGEVAQLVERADARRAPLLAGEAGQGFVTLRDIEPDIVEQIAAWKMNCSVI